MSVSETDEKSACLWNGFPGLWKPRRDSGKIGAFIHAKDHDLFSLEKLAVPSASKRESESETCAASFRRKTLTSIDSCYDLVLCYPALLHANPSMGMNHNGHRR